MAAFMGLLTRWLQTLILLDRLLYGQPRRDWMHIRQFRILAETAVTANLPGYFLLTCFLSSTPGVNLATRRAAILMTPPVWGLRPLRALRCETEKVPKPTRVTRSPFFSALVTASINVSIAAAALVLL